MADDEEIALHLVGDDEDTPTLEELVSMARKITGREPTPEEVEEARRLLATKME